MNPDTMTLEELDRALFDAGLLREGSSIDHRGYVINRWGIRLNPSSSTDQALECADKWFKRNAKKDRDILFVKIADAEHHAYFHRIYYSYGATRAEALCRAILKAREK